MAVFKKALVVTTWLLSTCAADQACDIEWDGAAVPRETGPYCEDADCGVNSLESVSLDEDSMMSVQLLGMKKKEASPTLPTPTESVSVMESNGIYRFGATGSLHYGDVELGGQSSFTVEYDIKMPQAATSSYQANLWWYGRYESPACGLGFVIRHWSSDKDMYMSGTDQNGSMMSTTPLDWSGILPTGVGFWGAWHTHRLVKSGSNFTFYLDNYTFDLGSSSISETTAVCTRRKFNFGTWYPVDLNPGHRGSEMKNLKFYYNQALGPIQAAGALPALRPSASGRTVAAVAALASTSLVAAYMVA